jgi:hypothetical protein
MRKIKFRAKTEYKRWFEYGFIVKENSTDFWYIDEGSGMQKKIIPETISQFTGLYDFNKNEIYEADILTNNVVVFYENGCFKIKNDKGHSLLANYLIFSPTLVLGNIFDNPDLLT